MSSQPEDAPVASSAGHASWFLVWNRRVHYYVGLYLLFFCWLFAFTGLLLNHPDWTFAQFWPQRVQTTMERSVGIGGRSSDLERARDAMRQLGLAGEIQWPATPTAPGTLAFQVSRPGRIVDVRIDVATSRATLQHTQLNSWGVLHLLHAFTGVRMGDTRNSRDWLLTSVWAYSMDALALGLIVMVASSYLMWYRLKTKRRYGWIALILGYATCAAFLTSLAWLL